MPRVPPIQKPISQERFLAKCFQAHGDAYDYTLTVYRRFDENVTITCRTHGPFQQQPVNHTRGKGCPLCGKDRWLVFRSSTAEQFITHARAIHGDRYDYSQVQYTRRNGGVPVTIVCTDHGPFRQDADKHLGGQGCPGCKGHTISLKQRKTREQFIQDARLIHGDRYGYELVEYVNARIKVTLMCRRHGPFQVIPDGHLSLRTGCAHCGTGNVSSASQRWLDSLSITDREYRIPGTGFKVDGFDPATGTIYEYLGCFWHGCPTCFDPEAVQRATKRTFGALFEATQKRLSRLKAMGYPVVVIWSCAPGA